MPQRDPNYNGNKGGECSRLERLAHCLRVEWVCPYCGTDLKEVKIIPIDHVKPQVHGGTKSDKNLIACCGSCNSSKQAKTLADFAVGKSNPEIRSHVRKCLRRKLPVEQAKALMGAK